MSNLPHLRNLNEINSAGKRMAATLRSISEGMLVDSLPNISLASEIESIVAGITTRKVAQTDAALSKFNSELRAFMLLGSAFADNAFTVTDLHASEIGSEQIMIRDYWELYSSRYREGGPEEGQEIQLEQDETVTAAQRLDELMDRESGQIERITQARSSIPAEAQAPIQVANVDNKLALKNQQTHIGAIDYAQLNHLRQSYADLLTDAIAEMRGNSNTDRRFISACDKLLNRLSYSLQDNPILALAVSFQSVSKKYDQTENELDVNIAIDLRTVLDGVQVILNHFQEWHLYNAELKRLHLDPDEAVILVECAEIIAEEMQKPNAPVDERIPILLYEMIEPAKNQLLPISSIAGPLLQSISNIAAVLSEIATNGAYYVVANPGVALTGVATLVPFALFLLNRLGPSAAKIKSLEFVTSILALVGSIASPLRELIKLYLG